MGEELKTAMVVRGKFERSSAMSALKDKVKEAFTDADGQLDGEYRGHVRQAGEAVPAHA